MALPPLVVELMMNSKEFKAGMAEADKSLTSLGNHPGMKKFAAASSAALKVGVTAGAAVSAMSLKMAGDFQKQTELLVTAGGESQKALKSVQAGILSIARQTGTSTSQLAEGMYTVEKAGLHGANGLKVLKAAAEGAKAENVDLGTMTNALTSIMRSYNLPASKAVTVTNELVAASGASKTSMQEFAGSLSTVLPIASAAHLSFAQVGGAIATLTSHGTSAQESTQELANTIRALQAPNNVAIKEMAQFGISSNDVSTKLGKRGLTGTLDYLTQTILSKMGPSGTVLLNSFNQSKIAAQDAQTMFSKLPASVQKVAQSYENGKLSLKDWRNDLKAMPADQAALATQWATTENQAKGFNQQLRSGTPAAQTYTAALKMMMGGSTGLNTALMLTGGSAATFTANVAKVADAGKKSGKDVSSWAQTQKLFNVQMDKAREYVETFAITLGTKLMPYVEKAIEGFGAFVGWLEKHTTVAKIAGVAVLGLATAMGIYSVAVGIANIDTAALATTMKASGIGLIIAGLAIGAYELYQHWSTIWPAMKKVFDTAWGAIRPEVEAMVGFFAHTLPDAISGPWNAVKGAVMAGVHGVVGAVESVLNPLIGWFRSYWGEISTVTTVALKLMALPIKLFWSATVAEFKLGFGLLKAATMLGWDVIKDVTTIAWDVISTYVKVEFDVLKAVAQVSWGAIKLVFQEAWDAISTMVKIAWDLIRGTVKVAFDIVRGIIEVGLDLLTGHWSRAWTDIRHTVGSVWGDIRGTVESVWGNIESYFSSALGHFKTFFVGTWRDIRDLTKNVWKDIKDGAKTLAGDFVAVFTKLPGQLGKVVGQIKNAFVAPINWVIDNVLNKFISGIDFILSKLHVPTIGKIPDIGGGGNSSSSQSTYNKGKQFAKGGVLPGYTPGRDVHQFYSPTGGMLALSGGEGIIVPEAVKALGGAAGIDAINSRFRSGKNPQGHYLFGGILHVLDEASGLALSGLRKIASMALNPAISLVQKTADSAIGAAPGPELLREAFKGIVDRMAGGVRALIGGNGGGSSGHGDMSAHSASASAAQRYAASILSQFGWGAGQMSSLLSLWNGESGWNNLAQNPTSTAFGIAQFLNSTWRSFKFPKTTNYEQQVYDGLQYIQSSYGSPAAAYSAWLSRSPHWYANGGVLPDIRTFDTGGWLMPGVSTVHNGLGVPEAIMPTDLMAQTIRAEVGGVGGVIQIHNTIELDGKQVFASVRKHAIDAERQNGNNGLSRKTR